MHIQRAKKMPKKERIDLFFVNQTTPRFELGKEDLMSPALPLGHVAKILEEKSRK
jgi:hypothetical protein